MDSKTGYSHMLVNGSRSARTIRIRHSTHFNLTTDNCVLQGGQGILMNISATRRTGSARMEIESVNVKQNTKDALAAFTGNLRGRDTFVCNVRFASCMYEEDIVTEEVQPSMAHEEEVNDIPKDSLTEYEMFPNGLESFSMLDQKKEISRNNEEISRSPFPAAANDEDDLYN